MNTLLIDFQKLGANPQSALKNAVSQFLRLGSPVAQVDASQTVKKTSGISFREAFFTFADSQQVVLKIKETGDIYQVLVNGRITPIKAQDEQKAAFEEIVGILNVGRNKFQAAMAKAVIPLPPSIKTAVPKMAEALRATLNNTNEAIQMLEAKLGIAPTATP